MLSLKTRLWRASEAVIRTRHIQWVKGHNLRVCSAIPRLNYCLMLNDRCIRSILASTEQRIPALSQSEQHWQDFFAQPRDMVGYVSVIDAEFNPEDSENETGEYYYGSVCLYLDCLFSFASGCENMMTGEQEWGYYGMQTPTNAIYTDGSYSTIESKEVCFFRLQIGSLIEQQASPRLNTLRDWNSKFI